MTDQAPAFDSMFPDRPWTVCFYSFRGGVGRTTLAVSAAMGLKERQYADELLLKPNNMPVVAPDGTVQPRGPRPFLLDFDLEAPGIDDFEQVRAPTSDQKGLVEYVDEYSRSERPGELRQFVYAIGERREKRWFRSHVGYSPSEAGEFTVRWPGLYVMRAGRRDMAHRKFLAQFDWEQFYRFQEGYLFFENLRAGVGKQLGCDYMLVDSRTGLTEVSSICLGHLADAVVLVFQPTTAHQQGLVDVVGAIRERERREERPIPRLYVASKAREAHEGQVDADQIKLAEEIVRRCESSDKIEGPLDYANMREVAPFSWPAFAVDWEYDYDAPALVSIRSRERVQQACEPGAYVVPAWFEPTHVPTRLEYEYGCVVHWILGARAGVINLLAKREAARRKAKDVLAMLRRLAPAELDQVLEKLDADYRALILKALRAEEEKRGT